MSSVDTGGNTPPTSSDPNSNSNSFFPWQPIFLAALAQSGNITYAANQAGITRQNAYLARSSRGFKGDHRLHALAFGQVWREALLHAAQTVELELRRRALEGEEREKRYYYKGQCVDVQKYRVYDNRLLLFLAKHTLSENHNDDIHGYLTDTFPLSLSGNHITGAGPESRPLSEAAYAQWQELTAIDDLVSELWCQVLDILDGSTDPNEAEEDDDDEAAEAEAETQPENADSQVSSQSDPVDDAPFRAESDSEASNPHLSDSQVPGPSETPASAKNPPIEPVPITNYDERITNDSPQVSSEPGPANHPTLDAPSRSITCPRSEAQGASAIDEGPSTPDLPPPGALIYDIDNAFKRLHGLT